MSLRCPRSLRRPGAALLGLALLAAGPGPAAAREPGYPITPQQRATAQQVAEAGVPLSELAPDAPDSHTVVRGDTLWGIASLFLKSPWRWPELWGMNLEQIRNPHLIYPGQVLVLERVGDRARLRLGAAAGAPAGGVLKLSPRVRDAGAAGDALSAVPLKAIESFLNQAVILEDDRLDRAPRIVAAQEGRVLMGRGDTAYVRGELGGEREWRVFRQPQALRDPDTREILGYEARYVGDARFLSAGGTSAKGETVPASFTITAAREEANISDRLAPRGSQDFPRYVPHAPAQPIDGRIVSIYGDALTAGQNQIVALNRGQRDGLERGHVLALWRAGSEARDTTGPVPQTLRLPDERHGVLFVFRTFERMAYALILQVERPVGPGDRFTQP